MRRLSLFSEYDIDLFEIFNAYNKKLFIKNMCALLGPDFSIFLHQLPIMTSQNAEAKKVVTDEKFVVKRN